MTIYSKDTFVLKDEDGLETYQLAEAANVGGILNAADMTVYDAADMSPAVYVADVGFDATHGGTGSIGDRIYVARPGDNAIVKVQCLGSVSEGDVIIADQTNVGYGKASTTADDVAKYKIGKAWADADSNGNAWVDLR